MRKLTILCDADDTIENLSECWISELNERYETSVNPEDITQWDISSAFPTLSKKQVYEILGEDDFWYNLSPIQDSYKYLKMLSDEGHELYLVTASDYRTCKSKMGRILELFPFFDGKHIIITHNKHLVRGDILIDDGPHNLTGRENLRILFDRPHNRYFDEQAHGITRAHTWEEVYHYVKKYESDLKQIMENEKDDN